MHADTAGGLIERLEHLLALTVLNAYELAGLSNRITRLCITDLRSIWFSPLSFLACSLQAASKRTLLRFISFQRFPV